MPQKLNPHNHLSIPNYENFDPQKLPTVQYVPRYISYVSIDGQAKMLWDGLEAK